MAGGGGRNNYGSTMERVPDVNFAGPGSSTRNFENTQFLRVCDTIASNIFAIGKHATTLEKTLKTIGSNNDSDTVRDSVHVVTKTALGTISETTAQIKEITVMMQKPLPSGEPVGNNVRMRVTRLTSDFQQSVQRFNNVQKQIVAKMKVTVLPTANAAALMDEESEKKALVEAEEERQAQLRLQQQLEFEQGLLVEREGRVRQIESDIVDCNDIMRDLALLVNEQGQVIDTIEEHVTAAHTEVEAGTEQLQKASVYQTRYRKRLLCLLVTGFVIAAIVIIILITQLKN